MVDFNDPNFLLADVEPTAKDREQMKRIKQSARDMVAVALTLAILWGLTVLFAMMQVSKGA